MTSHLNEEGKILLYYIYDLMGEKEKVDNCRRLQDYKRKIRQLPNEIFIEFFQGVSDIEERTGMVDGIVVYKKSTK